MPVSQKSVESLESSDQKLSSSSASPKVSFLRLKSAFIFIFRRCLACRQYSSSSLVAPTCLDHMAHVHDVMCVTFLFFLPIIIITFIFSSHHIFYLLLLSLLLLVVVVVIYYYYSLLILLMIMDNLNYIIQYEMM